MSISCDSAVRDLLIRGLFPSPRIWSLSVTGPIPRESQAFTDVVDLGENHLYTLLFARNFGGDSVLSSIEIYSSIDGVHWTLAPGYRTTTAQSYWIISSSIHVCGLPMGRYARVVYKNHSVFQVSGFTVELMAFSGV